MKFEGIYTPAITPLTQEGNIDKGAFAEVLESLLDANVHGIVIGARPANTMRTRSRSVLNSPRSPSR